MVMGKSLCVFGGGWRREGGGDDDLSLCPTPTPWDKERGEKPEHMRDNREIDMLSCSTHVRRSQDMENTYIAQPNSIMLRTTVHISLKQ